MANLCCNTCGLTIPQLLNNLSFNGNTLTYCPNCMCRAVADGSLAAQLQNDPNLIDDITGTSGAIKFSNDGETYCLNKDSMLRLLSYNLNPNEYIVLAQMYGDHNYMIHDDFYTDDGIAIQPID